MDLLIDYFTNFILKYSYELSLMLFSSVYFKKKHTLLPLLILKEFFHIFQTVIF